MTSETQKFAWLQPSVCSEMRDVILILLDLVYRSIVAEHEQAESCFFVQSQTVIFLSFLTLI